MFMLLKSQKFEYNCWGERCENLLELRILLISSFLNVVGIIAVEEIQWKVRICHSLQAEQ